MTDITNPLHITSVSFEKVSSSRSYVLVMGDGYLIHFVPSRPNKTPPKGLPNATDTPAAAAAANILRFWAMQT